MHYTFAKILLILPITRAQVQMPQVDSPYLRITCVSQCLSYYFSLLCCEKIGMSCSK